MELSPSAVGDSGSLAFFTDALTAVHPGDETVWSEGAPPSLVTGDDGASLWSVRCASGYDGSSAREEIGEQPCGSSSLEGAFVGVPGVLSAGWQGAPCTWALLAFLKESLAIACLSQGVATHARWCEARVCMFSRAAPARWPWRAPERSCWRSQRSCCACCCIWT